MSGEWLDPGLEMERDSVTAPTPDHPARSFCGAPILRFLTGRIRSGQCQDGHAWADEWLLPPLQSASGGQDGSGISHLMALDQLEVPHQRRR